jgi:large subunit ribosomal protein L21
MYAVVKTGGKQYRVSAGTKIKVEQLPADVGSEVTLDQVLMVAQDGSVKLGTPLVAGAAVTAKVVSQGRGDKVRIFKMRRRHEIHRRSAKSRSRQKGPKQRKTIAGKGGTTAFLFRHPKFSGARSSKNSARRARRRRRRPRRQHLGRRRPQHQHADRLPLCPHPPREKRREGAGSDCYGKGAPTTSCCACRWAP